MEARRASARTEAAHATLETAPPLACGGAVEERGEVRRMRTREERGEWAWG